jgi:hypothetical protein
MCLVAVLAAAEPCVAQKLVDPNTVAPEFRAAAEKRRAEQIKQLECRRKVEVAKVLARDQAAAITRCIDDGSDPATTAAHP